MHRNRRREQEEVAAEHQAILERMQREAYDANYSVMSAQEKAQVFSLLQNQLQNGDEDYNRKILSSLARNFNGYGEKFKTRMYDEFSCNQEGIRQIFTRNMSTTKPEKPQRRLRLEGRSPRGDDSEDLQQPGARGPVPFGPDGTTAEGAGAGFGGGGVAAPVTPPMPRPANPPQAAGGGLGVGDERALLDGLLGDDEFEGELGGGFGGDPTYSPVLPPRLPNGRDYYYQYRRQGHGEAAEVPAPVPGGLPLPPAPGVGELGDGEDAGRDGSGPFELGDGFDSPPLPSSREEDVMNPPELDGLGGMPPAPPPLRPGAGVPRPPLGGAGGPAGLGGGGVEAGERPPLAVGGPGLGGGRPPLVGAGGPGLGGGGGAPRPPLGGAGGAGLGGGTSGPGGTAAAAVVTPDDLWKNLLKCKTNEATPYPRTLKLAREAASSEENYDAQFPDSEIAKTAHSGKDIVVGMNGRPRVRYGDPYALVSDINASNGFLFADVIADSTKNPSATASYRHRDVHSMSYRGKIGEDHGVVQSFYGDDTLKQIDGFFDSAYINNVLDGSVQAIARIHNPAGSLAAMPIDDKVDALKAMTEIMAMNIAQNLGVNLTTAALAHGAFGIFSTEITAHFLAESQKPENSGENADNEDFKALGRLYLLTQVTNTGVTAGQTSEAYYETLKSIALGAMRDEIIGEAAIDGMASSLHAKYSASIPPATASDQAAKLHKDLVLKIEKEARQKSSKEIGKAIKHLYTPAVFPAFSVAEIDKLKHGSKISANIGDRILRAGISVLNGGRKTALTPFMLLGAPFSSRARDKLSNYKEDAKAFVKDGARFLKANAFLETKDLPKMVRIEPAIDGVHIFNGAFDSKNPNSSRSNANNVSVCFKGDCDTRAFIYIPGTNQCYVMCELTPNNEVVIHKEIYHQGKGDFEPQLCNRKQLSAALGGANRAKDVEGRRDQMTIFASRQIDDRVNKACMTKGTSFSSTEIRGFGQIADDQMAVEGNVMAVDADTAPDNRENYLNKKASFYEEQEDASAAIVNNSVSPAVRAAAGGVLDKLVSVSKDDLSAIHASQKAAIVAEADLVGHAARVRPARGGGNPTRGA